MRAAQAVVVLSLLCSTALMAAPFQQPQASPGHAPPLIPDAGFESGRLGAFARTAFPGSLSIEAAPENVYSGEHSLSQQATRPTRPRSIPVRTHRITLGAGPETLRLSGQVKGAAPDLRVRTVILCSDETGRTSPEHSSSLTQRLDTGWEHVSHTHTCPSTSPSASVRFESLDEGQTVWWDDLNLARIVNYLPDPGFESAIPDAPFAEALRGTLELDGTRARRGQLSLRHSASGPDSYTTPWWRSAEAAVAPATAHKSFSFSAWVTAETLAPVQVHVFCLDGGYDLVESGSSHATLTATAQWQQLEHSSTCPDRTEYVGVRLDNDGGAGSTVWWDDVVLEPSPPGAFVGSSRQAADTLRLTFEGLSDGRIERDAYAADGVEMVELVSLRAQDVVPRGEGNFCESAAGSATVGYAPFLLDAAFQGPRAFINVPRGFMGLRLRYAQSTASRGGFKVWSDLNGTGVVMHRFDFIGAESNGSGDPPGCLYDTWLSTGEVLVEGRSIELFENDGDPAGSWFLFDDVEVFLAETSGQVTVTDPDGQTVPDGGRFPFGEVEGGQTKEAVFTLSNTGAVPITVDGFRVEGDGFSPSDPPPPGLDANEVATFGVVFDGEGLESGLHEGRVTLDLGGADVTVYSFALEATVVHPPRLELVSEDGQVIDPAKPFVCCSLRVGDHAQRYTFSIRNRGDRDLVIDAAAVRNLDGQQAFRLTEGPLSPLAPYEEGREETETTIEVEFFAERPGEFRSHLVLDTNASDPTVQLELKGTVVATALQVRDQGGAVVPLNFDLPLGVITLPESVEEVFSVRNTGDEVLEILGSSEVVEDGPGGGFVLFSVGGEASVWPRTLPPGEVYEFGLRITPAQPGDKGAQVVLDYIEGDETRVFNFHVSARARGEAGRMCVIARAEPKVPFPADPNPEDKCQLYGISTVDFGQQPPGTEVELKMTFENIGDGPLTLDGFAEPAGGSWRVRFAPEPPPVLGPGDVFAAIMELVDTETPGRSEARINVQYDTLTAITATVEISDPDAGGDPDVQMRNVQGDTFDDGDSTNILPIPSGPTLYETFFIENNGTGYLTIADLEIGTDGPVAVFRPGTHPLPSVAPDEDTVLTIRIGPAPPGNYSGFISFKTNDPSAETFKLNLSVTVNDQQGAGPRAAFSAPGVPSVPMNGESDFGPTTAGNAVERTFRMSNEGTEELVISAIAALGDGFTFRSTPALRIAPGKSTAFSVRMQADAPGTRRSRVSFQTNAVNGPVVGFEVTGRVLDDLADRPGLSVSVFGAKMPNGGSFTMNGVAPHQSTRVPVTLQNTGDAPLEIRRFDPRLHPNFRVEGSFPPVLAPGAAAGVLLLYEPITSSPSSALATLEWFTNVPDAPVFVVTFEGITLQSGAHPRLVVNGPPVISNGGELFMGLTGPGCEVTDTVDLHNIGDGRLDLFDVRVTGEGHALASTPPAVVRPHQIVPLTVKQLGTEPGPLHGAVTIHSSDPAQGTYSFALRGEVLGPCQPGPTRLCLQDDRFEVEVDYVNHHNGTATGQGQATPYSDRTGLFWFFKPENIEVIVKILDGRPRNGTFWVYYGGLTDLAYTLTVRDTVTGRVQVFEKPAGNLDGDSLTDRFGEGCAELRSVTRSLPENPSAPLLPSTSESGPATRAAAVGRCVAGPDNLCLFDNRFEVEVDWVNQHDGGSTGRGGALPATDHAGMFWFFNDKNIEMAIKMHDGRAVNDHFWVFVGSLTDVEFSLRITDTVTGAVWTHRNPPGAYKGHADTEAFEVLPEIRVVQNWDGAELAAGSNVSFPETTSGQTATLAFRIHNDGDLALEIANATALVSGSGFVQVGVPPADTLQPGESTAFAVEYRAPAGGATSTGSVLVSSNDPDEPSFVFGLRGQAQAPPDIDAPRLSIAHPAQNEVLAGAVSVDGWATDASGVATLTFRLNGVAVQLPDFVYGSGRGDVCQVHSDLNDPNCPNVGWSATLDTTALDDGTHSLTVLATDPKGNTKTASRGFQVENDVPDVAPPRIWVDTPANMETLSGAATLSGWAVDASGVTGWSFRVDGNVVALSSLNTRVSRGDVCNAHADLNDPNCPNVGWRGVLNTTAFANGTHKLTVRLTDATGNVDGFQRWFSIDNPVDTEPPRIWVDTPGHMEPLSGATSLSGWAVDASGVTGWSFRVDGNVVTLSGLDTGVARGDVCNAQADLNDPNCPNVGWRGVLNTTAFANGTHKLTVRLTDATGNVDGFQRWFSIDN